MLSAPKLAALGWQAGVRTRRDAQATLPLNIRALVWHAVADMGTLATHPFALGGIRVSDSALSQRRARLPFALFSRSSRWRCSPGANPKAHPQACYHGLQLVGVVGTSFSVSNLPVFVQSLG